MSKKKHYGTDHQKKENQTQEKNLIGSTLRTSTGFEYVLHARNLQDMRFLDALVAMEDKSLPEEEQLVSMIRVVRMLLGETQKEALYAHVVKMYGWASPVGVGKEIRDIISNFDDGKKK